jgi:PBP1b-binding outer membrane lipoprotein LpoB
VGRRFREESEMNMKKAGALALVAAGLLLLGGCDQAEKAAQQMLSKTAETAKQAIDDTHKAAEQALSEATGSQVEKEQPEQERKESSQAI